MIKALLVGLFGLIALQGVNVGFRQNNFQVACTDKQNRKITFVLERNVLSLDGSCRADDGKTGADCRRELEVVGAEGGMCERVK